MIKTNKESFAVSETPVLPTPPASEPSPADLPKALPDFLTGAEAQKAVRKPFPVFSFAAGVIVLCAVTELGLLAAGIVPSTQLITAAMAGLALLAAVLLVLINRFQAALLKERVLLGEAVDEAVAGRAICDETGKALYTNLSFWTHLATLPEGVTAADHEFPERTLEACFAVQEGGLEDFTRVKTRARAGHFAAAELVRTGGPEGARCFLVEGWPSRFHKGYVSWRVDDVSSRLQVREAIEREQERWTDFMDHAPVGFFSVDQDGRFIFANNTLARWLGTSAAELTKGSLRLHDLMQRPPEGTAPHNLTSEAATYQQGEFTLKGPDGRCFQALIAQSVPEAVDGQFRTRAVVHDLTPERDWQAALQESQARFRRFFEESPVGVALVAEGGMLAECNPAFLKMLGGSATEILAQPLQSFIKSDAVDLTEMLARAADGAPPTTPIEVKITGTGGREMTFQLYVRRLENDDVTGARLMLHFIDLTEQKNLEVRFSQSQKMQAIGQLAGGVAHDFNNLLTAMIGFCDLLLLRHKPGDPSFGDIMQIKQNGNRAAGLVRQLLAFSRQQTLQPRVLNITDVLVDLSNLLRRLIGENIELKLVHARDLGLVKADQGQIEQVIINMAVNARDAMNGGGKLTVTTSNVSLTAPFRRGHEEVPAGDWIVVEVADTGTGIPPEIMDRIFDPFFSTKEVGKGTGLGLSTCYGIVKQTGGYVFVDSEMGRGTTFSIYLPRHVKTAADEEGREKAAQNDAQDLTGAGVILLVEDEDAVRMFASRALKNKGYTVLEARHGEHALEVIAEHNGRIDLVVSDVMMPGMDGPTMLRHIREQRPTLKAIFISGYSEERLKETFETSDDIYFLPKPFSLKQLAEKVKEVL